MKPRITQALLHRLEVACERSLPNGDRRRVISLTEDELRAVRRLILDRQEALRDEAQSHLSL